ncbi:TPR repeat-containing protein YrrB [Rhodoplanes serenus]|uniref:TPR repeat-containing protein YrrB n=1 Tax=Rhodoplanes serenus TaxID=200615 RepID=A0A3S4AZP2_9BRAD|nr:tetratricopeptide repeat protein [Rhodoplanes serenus]VCU08219.1 TPR repeat-containing protein YrrB [Rhodoplanes serenus]
MNRRDRRAAAKQGNAEAICADAAALKQQGKLAGAVRRYQEALEIAPRSAIVHNNLANLLTELGRPHEAIAHLRQALAADPSAALVHNNLANALARQGDTAGAIGHYRQALALAPDFAEALLALGTTLATLGAFDEAITHLSRAVALRPFDIQGQVHLGLALVERGDVAGALGCAEIAARLADRPGVPHRLLGLLLARCGAVAPARICFEAALRQDPEDRDGVALLLASLGDGPLPARASDRQIESLYAGQAARWDAGSAGPLGYRGARLTADALARLAPGPERLDVVDLGCGTGLVGTLVRPLARRLDGVDLSDAMLAQARAKGVYDALHRAEMVDFLAARPAAYDAVTAAAVLVHVGDLAPALAAAASALRDGGVLAATLFPDERDPDGFALGPLDGLGQSGCFVHGRGHLVRSAAAAGFSVEFLDDAVHEHQAGRDRVAVVVGLRRGARAG